MIIGIVFGEAGSGKSFEALNFPEPIIVYDLENRLDQKIKKHFPDKLIHRVNLALVDTEFNEDKVKSFNAFVQEINILKKLKNDKIPATVVVDGIGDLREYATEKWLTYAKSKDGKPRKKAQNPGDFEEINDLVRDSLFPLVNWAREFDVNLVWTSTMTDNYQKITKISGEDDSVKVGRKASHKDWCDYRLDFIVELWQPKNKGKIRTGVYMATCTKSEIGSWEEDITGKTLYDVFIEKGMI